MPRRLRNLLSVESGCDNGASFIYLFIGLSLVTSSGVTEGVKDWFYVNLLWQCVFGILLGFIIGIGFNPVLRMVHAHHFIGRAPTSSSTSS